MKQRSTCFDNYKIFGISTLVIYGVSFLIFFVSQIGIEYSGFMHYGSYDDLVLVTLLCCLSCAIHSVIWFLITVIWCIVIAIKEKSAKFFVHPLVITNIVLTVSCTSAVVFYLIQRRS